MRSRRSTEVKPIWFGSGERPLFGMFHVPESGSARAGVVVCPPFGRDYLHAHYTLRCLGDELTARGVCTLRFDYDGTGDSAGTGNEPQGVRCWLDSITAAVATMRASGVGSVFIVGMGLGATLAALVGEDDGNIDGLVLWDPEPSGKAYLSRQRALSALSFNVSTTTTDGSVDAPGILFDALTAADLRNLDLSNLRESQARMLVLVRPDRDAACLQNALRGDLVEWGEAIGHSRLIDDVSNMAVPREAVDRIVKWVGAHAQHEPQPISVPGWTGPTSIPGPSGRSSVVETPVWVGDTGLFGIVAESPGRNAGPTAIFLSVANGHRVGPARTWVDLARTWAETGLRSIRIDFSGLGDSPLRHNEQRDFEWCAPEAFDDVEEVARWCSPSDPSDVILVGLCASGYQAIDSAFHLTPRGVVAINPTISFMPPEMREGRSVDPRRRVVMGSSRLQERFRSDSPLVRCPPDVPGLSLAGKGVEDCVATAKCGLASRTGCSRLRCPDCVWRGVVQTDPVRRLFPPAQPARAPGSTSFGVSARVGAWPSDRTPASRGPGSGDRARSNTIRLQRARSRSCKRGCPLSTRFGPRSLGQLRDPGA